MKTNLLFGRSRIGKALLFCGIMITLLFNTSVFAQKRIVLHHLGQASVYWNIDSLRTHIQTGDTIYFPGAGYNIGDWSIDKTVTIYGTGHYPDSTAATGITYLTGNFIFKSGSSNSFIQGLYLTGSITLGSTSGNQVVNNLTISRCNFYNLYLSYDGGTTTTSNNIQIRDNVIMGDGFYGGNATNVLVTNNFIQSVVGYFTNTLFKNNIMMRGGFCYGGPFSYMNNCSFQNNVMYYTWSSCGGNYFMSNCFTNDFQYNAFMWAPGFPDGSNTGSNNWNNISAATFFVSQSGTSFNYTHNYHLQEPATYVGSDATQISLYGTTTPYKDGAVPINPHIRAKTIAPNTTTSGQLNVNITVAAQDN